MSFEKGISAYAGLGYTPDDNKEYVRLASQLGYSRLFTSLHIPEVNPATLLQEFMSLVTSAKQFGFQITADISPNALSSLNATLDNPLSLQRLGIDTLRLDFGYSAEEIAYFTQKSGLTIEINASTLDTGLLTKIIHAGADCSRLRACHNYYPRPETGLSYSLFCERSKALREHDIEVLAFIPSCQNPRPPIFAGLPTLEQHRTIKPMLAAKHLLASKLVTGIIFGDPLAPIVELSEVAALDETTIELTVELAPDISELERSILLASHTNRNDPGESVIRSQEARGLCHGSILPRIAQQRRRGTVTIDNLDYVRYMGELQLICRDLPSDKRVNCVAQVVPQELFLLDYIHPGCLFRFKENHDV